MSATLPPPGRESLRARLARAQVAPLLLDGPTGTQLEARGFQSEPTLWTGRAAELAPQLLSAIHRDYVAAGAELITANTFRTTAHAAQQAGFDPQQAHGWTAQAVQLARRATRGDRAAWVLGSLAPLADCYVPAQTPPDGVLAREHDRHAAALLAAGCDGILIETQVTRRESVHAVRAAAGRGAAAILVSFLPASDGMHLLGGDALIDAARDCVAAGADALLVNCADVDVLRRALDVCAAGSLAVPLGAYPNAARRHGTPGRYIWEPDPASCGADGVAAWTRALRDAGAAILGACCGFGPADTRAMAAALHKPARAVHPEGGLAGGTTNEERS